MSNIFGLGDNQFLNLKVLNNLDTTNLITANTVQAVNGNFTNLTGTISPGQLVVKHVETTRDNASLVVGSNLATLTTDSAGVHIGFDALSGQSSIYAVNNSNLTGELYLNMPFSLPNAGTHIAKVNTDNIQEETTNAGVKLADTITFHTNEIRNSDTIKINANGLVNNNVRIQSQDTDLIVARFNDVQIYKPLTCSSAPINVSNHDINISNGKLSINSGQANYGPNYMRIIAGLQDTIHVETNSTAGAGWIGGSFGGPDVGGSSRVVMGGLEVSPGSGQTKAVLGGHVYTNGIGYTDWLALSVNPAGHPVHIGEIIYASPNELSVSGFVDVATGYKIQDTVVLDQTHLLLNDTTNKPLLILQNNSTDLNNLMCIMDNNVSHGIAMGMWDYGTGSGIVPVIAAVKTDGINGISGEDGTLYINPNNNVNVGQDISFASPEKLNVRGSACIEGNVNINGVYMVNGTPISTSVWKEIHGSRYVTGISSGTYQTINVLTWNGVLSGLPNSTSMSIEGSGSGNLQYRVTNFNQTIVFFESPSIAFNTGIARVFSSNVVTPMNGSTLTTPLVFQVRLISGATYDVWSQSIRMS